MRPKWRLAFSTKANDQSIFPTLPKIEFLTELPESTLGV
jgi:hypothetical protein